MIIQCMKIRLTFIFSLVELPPVGPLSLVELTPVGPLCGVAVSIHRLSFGSLQYLPFSAADMDG